MPRNEELGYNKIVRKLLETMGMNNIDNVMSVANATKNPEIAIEMLTDIYEAPVLPLQSTPKYNDTDTVCTLVSFNPLASKEDTVEFTYTGDETRYIHWNTDVLNNKEEAIAMYKHRGNEEWDKQYEDRKGDYTSVSLLNAIGEVQQKKYIRHCSLKNWLDNKIITPEIQEEIIIEPKLGMQV